MKQSRICLLNIFIFLALIPSLARAAEEPARVHQLKITVLSTMLAEMNSVGEWGFAALVEADGRRLLLDTGTRPDTVIINANSLNIDLSSIEDVFLSHNHFDHIGGLARLRSEFKSKNPHAFEKAHVAPQIFWKRFQNGKEWGEMQQIKQAFEAEGGHFEIHEKPFEIMPGVWFTATVPRKFPERNFPKGILVRNPEGIESEDNVPEDSSLVFNTDKGLAILTGCGHAGVVNTTAYAREIVRPAPIAALIGGLHLFGIDDSSLRWTASKLNEFKVGQLLGAHCTGIEAVFELRKQLGLSRNTAIVAAVGSSYSLDQGLEAGGVGLAK